MIPGWQNKKEISLGDIIAFFCAFAVVVIAYATLDKRIAVTESAVAASSSQGDRSNDKQDTAVQQLREEVREQLRDINAKLDALIKRR